MLDLRTITVTLQGETFTVPEPTRRVARRLQAGVLRIAPKMFAMRSALANAGLTNAKPTTDEMTEIAQKLDLETSAAMLDLYDPLCDWLLEAIPGVPARVIENAEEAELVRAFTAVKEFIEAPFLKSGHAAVQTALKPSVAIPPSSISDALPPSPTPNGSPASTS